MEILSCFSKDIISFESAAQKEREKFDNGQKTHKWWCHRSLSQMGLPKSKCAYMMDV